MNKINFVSNPLITFYKMYYDRPNDYSTSIDLRPDQIPELIIPALSNACCDKLVMRLALFIDMNDPDTNHVDAIIYSWDGIAPSKKYYKLFGDGSYELDLDKTEML